LYHPDIFRFNSIQKRYFTLLPPFLHLYPLTNTSCTHVILVHIRRVDGVSNAVRAEYARGDGRVKRKEDKRRERIEPNETLFVVNFNEDTTKREDLDMLFRPYGDIKRIEMKRNYAFVQFANVDQASRAKEATNGGKLDESVINVEYVASRIGDVNRGRDRRDFGRDRDRDYRGPRRDFDRDRPPYREDRAGGGGRYDERGREDRFDRPARREREFDRDENRPFEGGYRDREYRGRERSRSPRSPPRRDDYGERGGTYDRRGRSPNGGRREREYDDRRRDDDRAPRAADRLDEYGDRGGYDRRGRSPLGGTAGRTLERERVYEDRGRGYNDR